MIISGILLIVCLALLFYIGAVKKELKNFKEELKLTQKSDYNRQLRVSLFDKDLTALASQMNQNLDYQKKLKQRSEDAEGRWKQSVSDIAHDLRTPLTVVKGNLQLLGKEEGLTEKQRSYAKVCLDKTDALKHMVDDFFELSVLESDTTPVDTKLLDVTSFLVQFIVDHETIIREHGLQPDIQLPERSVMIWANEELLVRMLGNLLGNVLKHAQDTFQISMTTTTDSESPMCGIIFANQSNNEDLDETQLFTRAYQGNRARSAEGAGLGLYIVKLLADKQRAEVFARKEENELQIGIRFPMKQEKE
ncbi:MAG: HAMP domain-containing histidine kinase [Lachnospiraceae bacterium]|nr:HAMP domain-containing histidine kinase [Lachnospiraceae bacterium]